jgi:hypothetical protein
VTVIGSEQDEREMRVVHSMDMFHLPAMNHANTTSPCDLLDMSVLVARL